MSLLPEITRKIKWIEIESYYGLIYLPWDLIQKDDPTWEDIKDYVSIFSENQIWEINIIMGHGVRLSASGYLDCTEWCVFDTVEECIEHVHDAYDIIWNKENKEWRQAD